MISCSVISAERPQQPLKKGRYNSWLIVNTLNWCFVRFPNKNVITMLQSSNIDRVSRTHQVFSSLSLFLSLFIWVSFSLSFLPFSLNSAQSRSIFLLFHTLYFSFLFYFSLALFLFLFLCLFIFFSFFLLLFFVFISVSLLFSLFSLYKFHFK